MVRFEKLSEFKKAVKAMMRGAIKAGIFADEGKYVFDVERNDENAKTVRVSISNYNCAFTMTVEGEVSTRVYNKVVPAFFEPIVAQFEKLSKVESITVR